MLWKCNMEKKAFTAVISGWDVRKHFEEINERDCSCLELTRGGRKAL